MARLQEGLDASLAPAPASTSERERLARFERFQDEMMGYMHIKGTRPRTLAYGLTDSPVGQLAAMEAPEQLVADVREFFRKVR